MTSKKQQHLTKLCACVPILFFDDTSSESESSCSEEDFLEDWMELTSQEMTAIFSILSTNYGEIIVPERIVDYVERVIPGYSREIFKQHFRMYRETVDVILTYIGEGLQKSNRLCSGRNPIDAKKQFLIALWFMATPDTYRSVKTKFGVGSATAFRAVRRVTYALHCLSPYVIKWPSGREMEQNINSFQQISGFPGIVGAIDGTHINIRAPSQDADSYINRKGFHSIQLQLVCNVKTKFIHCHAGHPGSVHDARVFRNSEVVEFLNNPHEYFPNNTHLLGDSAYPLHNHLMVPFRDNGHLNARQKNYNFCLSSARMAIERSIGLLKARFRIILDCLPLYDIHKITEFLVACCVLHNICMSQNDFFEIEIQDMPADQGEVDHNIQVRRFQNDGAQKRNRILNTLEIRQVR